MQSEVPSSFITAQVCKKPASNQPEDEDGDDGDDATIDQPDEAEIEKKEVNKRMRATKKGQLACWS